MSNTKNSQKNIIALLGVALIISSLGLLLSVQNSFVVSDYLTGAVSGTGTQSLQVSGTAGLTVDDASVAFVTGFYNASCTIGRGFVSTDGEYLNHSCWLNTSTLPPIPLNDPHTLSNSGSLNLNISANLSIGTSTSVWNLTCNVTNSCGSGIVPHLLIKAKNNEAGSCISGLQDTYTNFSDNSTNSEINLCADFDYQDGTDSIDIDFNLTIPKDATQGSKSITVQYLGKST